MSNIDFSKLTVSVLKDYLRQLKLPLGGNKPDLVLRLQVAYGQVAAPPAATAAPPMPAAVVPQAPPGYPAALPAPALTAPVVAQMAGLPVVTAPVAAPKTKAPAKSPLDTLKSAVRNADQTLSFAVAAVLEVYGASDRAHAVAAALAGITENKPLSQVVPETAEGLRTLKVEDLKKILKDRGEKVGGKKDELIHRILNPTPKEAVQAPPLPALGAGGLPPLGVLPALGTEDDAMDADTEPEGDLPQVPQVPGLPVGVAQFPATLPMQVSPPALPVAGAASPRGGLPTMQVPTVPGLPLAVASPRAALPTMQVPGLPVVGAASPRAALPTMPALPTTGTPNTLPVGLPTIPGGLPVAGSPRM